MVFSSPADSMQSSTFGSPSIFGQSHNPGNSPFPSKPFDSVTAFGAPTGGSIFGETSTSTFGATSSSTSSTVFGSPMPAFTASSSSSFGGSSIFGQKPAFGASSTTGFGFSSTPSFGQPTIPAVSSSFLVTTQSPFGTRSSPSGGQARIPTLGSTDFGQSVSGEKCGSKVSSYKRTVVDEGRLVSISGMPVYNDKSHEELRWEDYHFGDKGGSRVGTSTIHEKAFTPLTAYAHSSANTSFSSTLTPTFSFPVTKVSNTAFSSSPPLGTSFSANSFAPTSGPNSSPSLFGPSSSPAFTSCPSIFNSTTPSSINHLSSSILTFKPNSSPSLFGPSSSPAFTSSPSIFNSSTPSSINPFSSSVPTFGPNSSPSPFGPSSSPAFTLSPSIFNSTTPTSTNPFSSSIPSNPFEPKGSVSLFGPSTSAFSFSPSIFNSTTPASTNPFSSSIPSNSFEPNSSVSLSSPSTSPAFSSSPSISSSTSAPRTAFVFEPNFFTTSSPAVTSSPSILSSTEWGTKNTPSLFGPPANLGFSPGLSFAFTQSSPLFTSIAPSSSASFLMSKLNTIISPSTGSVFKSNLFSCTPSRISTSTVAPPGQTTPSFSTLFQPAQTAQTRGSSGGGGVDGGIGQSTAAQEFVTQSTAEVKLPSVLSPFGTLPAMPQQSIALRGSTPSLKYGISSIPVSGKQAPVRVSSSLTIQHLSQRRNRLPVQKYDPKSNERKVPFFSDELPTPAFIPRENPRALVIRPSERWPLRVNSEKISPLKCSSIHVSNENSQDDAEAYAPVLDGAIYQDENGNSGENSTAKSFATESATAYANLTALLPKLHKCSDYYTEPQIQELASKERAEPGSISRVKDFMIGRHGYGSIKFLGSTDVRQLDLESLIQFNSREVIVYPDESKKHPVGQGLNKPAEVTLLNIKYIDKRTGNYVDGPKADRYREMLIKKATEQGAEFVSYDPVVGEWKFRVQNFN